MGTVLQEIQATVIQYAEVISNLIKVDVEIVDDQLVRIAGTGVYANQMNKNISREGYVYKEVLATGNPQYIAEPGHHKLCHSCLKQYRCTEKFELCTPIKLKDEIIGIIGLICFSDEQRDNVLKDFKTYQQFLNQIAGFISAKAYEWQESERHQKMMNLLTQIMNNMDKGVVALNSENRIVQINSAARKQLLFSGDNLEQTVSIKATGDSMLGEDEYKVEVGNRTFHLMGKLLSVSSQISYYSKIFIFDEIRNVKSGIYGLTNVATSVTLDHIIGKSEAIEKLKNKIRKIASSNSTVLITGASGTGKEMVARAIHALSNRADKPFIAINCAAIPDTLLESELFGYVKGAFTGADPRGKIGKFELANKGIIFLDEVGDMPIYLQAKLLRVLQERKLMRIGSNQVQDLDIRVIAATNKDLKGLIQENKFREDLYYRLNVIPLETPALCERTVDIPLLVKHMMEKYCTLFNKDVRAIDRKAMDILVNYSWPGNVRELENTVEFMINMAEADTLTLETLPRSLVEYNGNKVPEYKASAAIRPLREVEQDYILQVLERFGRTTEGKVMAAKALGIGIATLYRKLNKDEDDSVLYKEENIDIGLI